MAKIDFDFKVPGNADQLGFLLGNGQGVMLSCCNKQKSINGIITLTWMTPTSHSPFLITVSVGNGDKEAGNDSYRFCHSLISQTKAFGLNVPTNALVEAVTKVGTTHSDEVDKYSEAGLTPFNSRHILPSLIEECFMNVECRVFKQFETGDHTVFVAEPLAVHVDDDVWVDGKFTEKYRDKSNLIYLGDMISLFNMW